MIDKIHSHILDELRINAKSDTVFILSSVLLNFTTLSINSAISNGDGNSLLIMFIFVALAITVSLAAEVGLIKGRQASKKLITGLIRMYEDSGTGQYYDESLLDHYRLRYNIFILIIFVTGIISVVVPFLMI